MNRILELAGIYESKSDAEFDARDKMISRIEGYFGTLESVPYSKISTKDLTTIYKTLVDKKQVQGIKAVNESKDFENLVERLGKDIIQNWMSMDEQELFKFLKKNIDDKWMSYLQNLSDDELKDVIDQAYHIAQNN